MNELQYFITAYQKAHNLTRGTLIEKIGYKNRSRGLRVLDAFIKKPVNQNFKLQLCKNLNIAIESIEPLVLIQLTKLKKAVELKAEEERQARIRLATPYLRVTILRFPSALAVGMSKKHLFEIPIPKEILTLPIESQLELICILYKQHQLDLFAEKYSLYNKLDNHRELVRRIKAAIKVGAEVDWYTGQGFTYHRSYIESYRFDKYCSVIYKAEPLNNKSQLNDEDTD